MAGTSGAEVGRFFGVHRPTIQHLRRRFQQTGSISDGHRSGQPRVTTSAHDHRIETHLELIRTHAPKRGLVGKALSDAALKGTVSPGLPWDAPPGWPVVLVGCIHACWVIQILSAPLADRYHVIQWYITAQWSSGARSTDGKCWIGCSGRRCREMRQARNGALGDLPLALQRTPPPTPYTPPPPPPPPPKNIASRKGQ